MSYEQILTEVRGRVGIISFNRPDKLNAMTETMGQEIKGQVDTWNGDDSVGAIVLTGAGRAFSSGTDIGSFEEAARGRSSDQSRPGFPAEWAEIVRDSKPVVCAINGVAVGFGVTLTLPCDVRVAAKEARLSMRFVRIGLTPEAGSTHYLVHLIGLGRALELMLTGRFIEGEEAERIGLVNHVCATESVLDRAVEVAQEMADNPDWQLRKVKHLVHNNYLDADLAGVIAREGEVFRQAQATAEHKEALVAFRERREPSFH